MDQYTADCTRPLNITCTDNRIICSAVRRHIEPIVGPAISMSQRGFLKYRSMLANILDIEEEMIAASLSYDDPAAVFFDFEGAFPSVSQEFLLDVIVSLGWPPWLIRLVQAIYWNNRCSFAMGVPHSMASN